MTVFRPSFPPPSCTTTRMRSSGTPGRLATSATSQGLFMTRAVRVMNAGTVQLVATIVNPFVTNSRLVNPWLISWPPHGKCRLCVLCSGPQDTQAWRCHHDFPLHDRSTSCQLVFRNTHDQVDGGAQLVGESRVIPGDRGVFVVCAKRAKQCPSLPRSQRRLDESIDKLGYHVAHALHLTCINEVIHAGGNNSSGSHAGRRPPGGELARIQPGHPAVQQQAAEVVADQDGGGVDPAFALRPSAHVRRIEKSLA